MADDLRSLDRLVAERVLGLKPYWCDRAVPEQGEMGPHWRLSRGEGFGKPVDHYSADTDAGWAAMRSIVERMRELGWNWGMQGEASPNEVCAEFWRDNPSAGVDKLGLYIEANGAADTLPEAVCRAALAALGEGDA